MIRIALGRECFEHPRFVAMRSHYGYDSFLLCPPRPTEPFDLALPLCRVDAKARICVRQSVLLGAGPLHRRLLEVRLGATMITVYDGAVIIAEHPRRCTDYEDLILDHDLEVLSRKPGALAGATALPAARASWMFTLIINGSGDGSTAARQRARHPRPDRGVAAAPSWSVLSTTRRTGQSDPW